MQRADGEAERQDGRPYYCVCVTWNPLSETRCGALGPPERS
jgi:hypothetical protein